MLQKRGPLAKLDKDQLLPGEFAIPTDSDSIFVCLSAGNVIEIPSKQAMQSLLDTLTEVVNKSETIIDDFEALEVEKAAINDNETSTVTTYSSEKIMQLIDAINEFSISIVDALPTEDIDTHTIYFVPKEESENDVYDEFIYINNAWEHIGSTEIDLSGYYTSAQVDAKVSELNSNLGSLFIGEHLSGEVNLDVIYTNMRTNSMKLVQLGSVTGGTGLPSGYYSYSIVFMIKGASNYGMMIMLSLNNTSIMFTKLVTSGNGSGNWMRTTRTTDA